MQRVHAEQDFSAPVDRVFAHLAEHEHLAPLFGARVKRLRDGTDGHRNGVGSVRELRLGPLPPFEETVTQFVPNERIVYEITKGSPLKGHRGVMLFSEGVAGGSRLTYEIVFGSKVPGVDRVVKVGLGRTVRAGLADLATTLR